MKLRQPTKANCWRWVNNKAVVYLPAWNKQEWLEFKGMPYFQGCQYMWWSFALTFASTISDRNSLSLWEIKNPLFSVEDY